MQIMTDLQGFRRFYHEKKTVAKMRDMFDFDQSCGVWPFYCSGCTSLAFSFSRVHFVSFYQLNMSPWCFFFLRACLIRHVPLVSLSTGFHCNTFQSVQLLLSLLQVLLVYIASSLEVKDRVPESTCFFFRLFYQNSKFADLTAMILKFNFYLF